jgi:alanine racemase
MPVVKADAYGHGAVPLAKIAVEEAGVASLAVARCEEGVALRQAGITVPIVVMGTTWPEEVETLIGHRLCPVIGSYAEAMRLHHATSHCREPYPIHVKIDTGMGRLGLLHHTVPAFVERLRSWPRLRVEGLMTHLATADAPSPQVVQAQRMIFAQVVQLFARQGLHPRYLHMANSAAIYRYPESHWTLVRPGIALYGSHPFESHEATVLRPVLSWKTRLVRVQALPVGYGISYGHTFITRRPSVIGTLPVGYADGLCRRLSNVGEVLVDGRRVPLVGQICMDMCMVDLTDVPQVQVGDEVVLIGAQKGARITAEDMAARCGLIPYEIFCAIAQRVPRQYVGK